MGKKEMLGKAGLMLGGAIAGFVGLKIAKSKTIKKAIIHTAAVALRAKEAAMDSGAAIQENAGDIVAAAKEVNRQKEAEEAAEKVEEAAQAE